MTSDFIDKWFSLSDQQKFDFIERSVLIHDSKGNTFPLVLAPFQKEWLLQGPLFTDFRNLNKFKNRIALKCRNVGASYIMIALESVFTGYIYPKVTIPFIAPTEDQTKVLIESCISLINDLRFDVALKGGIKGQTKSEINFLNGSKIKAFSSNPRGMRGTRALSVYCVPYNENIITDVGSVPIGDVVTKGIGNMVLSYNHTTGVSEWKPIVERMKNKVNNRKIVKLTTDSGSFSCTVDHPVYCNGSYVKAIDADTLFHDGVNEKVSSKEVFSTDDEYVYNIEVADNHNYYVNGFLTHNCDEMAHLERDQEVYDAVNYFIAGGGQLNVLSTPFGKQNLYWRIWSDRKSYTNWYRLDIKAFDGEIDINRSLKEQIDSGTIKPIIPWLNIDKVEADRKGDSHNGYRNFMQEMLGIPLEEVSSVISTELLNTVTKDYFVLEGRDPMSNQVFGVGVDYGASNNMTAAVTGIFESGRLVVCNTSQFSGNVDVQINNIVEYTNRFSHDYYFGDATGLGGHSFQDVLSARDVKVGMIVGVDYAKKDIATRFGSKMNNKEFMINRALELFARGKIIVPHNFRELRLQILGVKKYVYDNHIKYSGKDSLTKNDDLAMAFFQLVLAYDYHYGISDLESVSSSNADWFNRESKPKFKKAQYFEGGSVKGLKINRSNGGFGKFG